MRSLPCLLTFVIAITSCEASNYRLRSAFNNMVRDLVVGGDVVRDTDYNFVAYMGNGTFLCNGALVNERYVLTSARCLETTFTESKPDVVRVGALNDLSLVTDYSVECVLIHPDYDSESMIPIADIALLRLDADCPNDPVPLNMIENYPTYSSTLSLLGHGRNSTNFFSPVNPYEPLQELEMSYVEFAYCNANFSNALTEGKYFCAGGQIGEGGCFDQGAPLIGIDAYHSHEDYILTGVYVYDEFNCGNGIPDIFTPIAPYSIWIQFAIREGCPATPLPSTAPSISPMPTTSPSASPTGIPSPSSAPTLAPTASPTAAPTNGPRCFSSDATVNVLGQGQVTMRDLQVGQKVFAGYQTPGLFGGFQPVYETVYGFGHRNEEKVGDYLRITTASGQSKPLEISESHLIYVKGRDEPVRADSLRLGDELWHHFLDSISTVPVRVTKIEKVLRQGLYQPLTKDGTILVDGIQASTYVSVADMSPRVVELGLHFFSEQSGFHLWMAPYRFVCTKVSPQLCVNDYNEEEDGINHYLTFGKYLLEFGEQLPTWVMAVFVALVLFFCGVVECLDSFLDGDAKIVVPTAVGLAIYWMQCCRKRCTGKAKVA